MGRREKLHESLPSLVRVVARFWPYIRQHRLLLTGSCLALVAEIALRLLEPWPLKFVLDRVIVTAPTGGSPYVAWLDALDPMTLLTLMAFAVVTITGLRGLAEYFNSVGLAVIGDRVVTDIRTAVYAHVQRLSVSFHSRAHSGDLLLRVIGDAAVLRDVTVTALLPLITSFLTLAAMVGFMLWVNWQLTLIALVPLPFAVLQLSRLGRRMREAARTQRHREGVMAATASEAIGAMRVVHALSLEERFSKAFTDHNRKSGKESTLATRAGARLERTVNIVTAVSTAAVLWQGTRLVLVGALTPGDLIVYLAYLKNAFKPGKEFAKYTTRIGRAAAAGERVLDLLDRTPEIRDLPGAVHAPAFRGAVRFEQLTFGYDTGRPVLRDIDVSVQPGQRVAVMGPSGSGKSTLVSLLVRLYDPSHGRVLIDGRDVREYTLASLRAQVSIVLQDPWLFGTSVRDNIAYGLPDAGAAEIEAAARLCNAHDFISALPQQYDTVLGERGVTLSNGQRQRIALARAAIRPAPVVILDEPTTGLDFENERAVLDALDRLAVGRTVFLITHDPSLATHADLILYLEDGRIVERGVSADLHRDGVFARLTRQAAAWHAREAYPEVPDAITR
ncbi:MAG: ABC transporter ATP-binding protein [Acidobacteria bacterium]|nr:MAG: ABC transporter ATP-binding protein [Acidobacteriota bacterium]